MANCGQPYRSNVPPSICGVASTSDTMANIDIPEPALPVIDPSVLVFFSNSCNPSIIQPSGEVPVTVNGSQFLLLILSSITVLIEALALVVLSRPSSVRFKSMRNSVKALTAVEIWLNSTIFLHEVFQEFFASKTQRLSEFYFTFFLFSVLNSAICSRNWLVTLIAMARCEAITRPMASRVFVHIFSPRRLLIYLGVLIVCSFALSTFRLAIRQILVCTNLNNAVVHRLPSQNSTLRFITEKVFFAYQSAIPITVVTIATVFMITALLRHRIPSDKSKETQDDSDEDSQSRSCCSIRPLRRQSLSLMEKYQRSRSLTDTLETRNPSVNDRSASGCVVTNLQTVRLAQRLPNQLRATRFILFIALVFIACEAPVFFAVVFVNYMPPVVVNHVYAYLRFLIVVDSIANFAIYLLTGKPFREELVNVICCKRRSERLNSLSWFQTERGRYSRTSIPML